MGAALWPLQFSAWALEQEYCLKKAQNAFTEDFRKVSKTMLISFLTFGTE